jgi:hypothetical protein
MENRDYRNALEGLTKAQLVEECLKLSEAGRVAQATSAHARTRVDELDRDVGHLERRLEAASAGQQREIARRDGLQDGFERAFAILAKVALRAGQPGEWRAAASVRPPDNAVAMESPPCEPCSKRGG